MSENQLHTLRRIDESGKSGIADDSCFGRLVRMWGKGVAQSSISALARNAFHNLCRATGCQREIGDIVCNNAVCPHHYSIAYGHAGKHAHVVAKPHVIAYDNTAFRAYGAAVRRHIQVLRRESAMRVVGDKDICPRQQIVAYYDGADCSNMREVADCTFIADSYLWSTIVALPCRQLHISTNHRASTDMNVPESTKIERAVGHNCITAQTCETAFKPSRIYVGEDGMP